MQPPFLGGSVLAEHISTGSEIRWLKVIHAHSGTSGKVSGCLQEHACVRVHVRVCARDSGRL